MISIDLKELTGHDISLTLLQKCILLMHLIP